jgi:sugar lactone lactonase YvrE
MSRVSLANARSFGVSEGEGIPDGAAMDVEGCYWSAMFDGWRIARFSPQGEQLEEYRCRCVARRWSALAGGYENAVYHHHPGKYGGEVAKYPLSGAIFTLPVAWQG